MRAQKAFQHAAELRNDLRKAVDDSATGQISHVVHDDLETQDPLAFGVDLQRQLAEMQFEHCQVIRRCLEHDCQPRSMFTVSAWPTFRAEQSPQLGDVQSGAGTVDHALKDLLHLCAVDEQQIATVLHLVDGIVVVKCSPFLLFNVECEAQACRVDSTLTHLAEPPYSLVIGQGICKPRQASAVGHLGEGITLLAEVDFGLRCPTRDVLMPVQDNLGTKRWMTTHLDGDVTPLRIHNVEGVVVDIRLLLLEKDAAGTGTVHVPQWHLGAPDQPARETGRA